MLEHYWLWLCRATTLNQAMVLKMWDPLSYVYPSFPSRTFLYIAISPWEISVVCQIQFALMETSLTQQSLKVQQFWFKWVFWNACWAWQNCLQICVTGLTENIKAERSFWVFQFPLPNLCLDGTCRGLRLALQCHGITASIYQYLSQ